MVWILRQPGVDCYWVGRGADSDSILRAVAQRPGCPSPQYRRPGAQAHRPRCRGQSGCEVTAVLAARAKALAPSSWAVQYANCRWQNHSCAMTEQQYFEAQQHLFTSLALGAASAAVIPLRTTHSSGTSPSVASQPCRHPLFGRRSWRTSIYFSAGTARHATCRMR